MDNGIERLQAALKQVKSELNWKVEECATEDLGYHIRSSSLERVHRIGYLSSIEGEYQHLSNRMHEYCHAFQGENVDILLADSTYIVSGLSEEDRYCVDWCVNVASDWFCDAEFNRRFPESYSGNPMAVAFREAEDFYRTSKRIDPVLALIAAQEQYYMNIVPEVPDKLKPLIHALLSINPTQPSRKALVELTNSLLSHYRPGVIFKPLENKGPELLADCNCGVFETIPVGSGQTHVKTVCNFPCLCETCHSIVSADLLAETVRCPKCLAPDPIPYDNPRLSESLGEETMFNWDMQGRLGRDLILTLGNYQCPQCGEMTLQFIPMN
jgi:hypothetical protein